MRLITLDQARDHVKADGDDDDLLELYCNAAEAVCARLANRSLYPTAQSLTVALGGINSTMIDAYIAYDASIAAAAAADDSRITVMMEAMARTQLNTVTSRVHSIVNGIALDTLPDSQADDIRIAVLLTVGHFYRNRSNVMSGQGAAAVEVPMTAQHIMEQHRYVGPL